MTKLEDAQVQEFLKAYGIGLSYDASASPERKSELDNFFNNTYGYQFELWEKTPYQVRNHYFGRVPQDILAYVATCDATQLKIMSENPGASKSELEEKTREAYYNRPEDSVLENTATFAAAVAVGYTVAQAHDLANERMFRDSLREKALSNTMTDEEKRLWRQSRENTRDIILQHKIETTPERALIYYLAKANKGEMKPEELMPRLADIIQRIETNGRHQEMEKMFEHKRFQNLYRRLNPDLRDLVDGIRKNEFANLKNANLNFQTVENAPMPYDVARFVEKSQRKHQQLKETARTLTANDLRNYISGMQQRQQ